MKWNKVCRAQFHSQRFTVKFMWWKKKPSSPLTVFSFDILLKLATVCQSSTQFNLPCLGNDFSVLPK